MQKSKFNQKRRQNQFLFLLLICLVTIGFLSFKNPFSVSAQNGKTDDGLTSYKPDNQSFPSVEIGERVSPWLKLQAGKPSDTTFYGNRTSISALQNNLTEPTAQASADVNADGYADLISGFRSTKGGGLIALHRASKEAFMPQNEQVLANLRQGVFPAAFEKDALVINVPTAPDFIVTGKFSKDSAVDIVFASRAGHSIYLLTSDGSGGFNHPQEIAVGGEITAMASDNIDNSRGLAGIVLAVNSEKSSNLLVFSGKDELSKTAPQSIPVDSPVDSLILAKKDYTVEGIELFGLADGGIFTISDIGHSSGGINKIELPYRAVDFAVGEFIRDRQGKPEIAVLGDNGTISYLTNGTLDTRPFTREEMQERFRRQPRGFGDLPKRTSKRQAADNWTIVEENSLNIFSGANAPRLLRKALITGNETDDLLAINPQSKQVEILFKEPNGKNQRTSFTGETKMQTVGFAETPMTVLPMRLNVMGQQGFVTFTEGSLEPTTVMFAPNAGFAVTTTTDENNGACSAAGTGCSLREAIIAANNAAGADMITFNVNGTFQLTIAGANENLAATGDLDIRESLTITGNGAANTIIQAGSTNANGIDKVFSVNPTFTVPITSSFSNMTMRFGRNPSAFAGDGYGGAVDQELSGTGSMTMSGVAMDSNSTADGPGGAVAYTQSVAGPGTVSLSNVTITNNISRRVAVTGSFGGGIFDGINTPLALTTVNVSNNSIPTTNPNSGGGGIFVNGSSAATYTFSGLTLFGNSLSGQGGGMYTGQGTTINPPTIISNNIATGAGQGGGIYEVLSGETLTISKATMVGNNAAVRGGAIEVQGGTLSMSFSRIVNNISPSFNGLSVIAGATANVENNWWGCNTGPSAAPCDIAGGGGAVDFTPWLRYTHTASPSLIVVGQSTTLTASFLTNSDNTPIAASNLDVLIGLPIAFNTPVRGTISGAQPTIQATGTATATFTATSAGAGSANAAVDNGTATASITIAAASTTTTLTSNANPSVVGQSVTLTATVSVTAPGAGTPTGTVQFKDGATVIASCNAVALTAGGTAQCTTTALTLGSHTITAVYSGDTNFTTSTSPNFTQTVNKANTTTAITNDTPDPSVVGQNYAVTASVSVNSPGAGTPTGTITVSDGTNTCTITLPATSCNLPSTSAGAKTLTATYNGDTNFNVSPTSTGVSHMVNKANTTTTTNNHTPNPSPQSTAVTVTFSVAVTSPGAGTPTGNVTVSDGVNNCTASAAAGSCMITLTTSGMRTLTATYAGDANFNGSVSAGVSQTVTAPTAAAVEISGRVLTAAGRGISNAVVSVTDSSGSTRTARTNTFGYFRFAEIQAGETYVISVNAKRYQFAQQVVNILENLTDLRFIAGDKP